MLNVIALQGRLVRDPELRQTQSGKQVATFTLAVDRGRKDANGKSVWTGFPSLHGSALPSSPINGSLRARW
jgi:hypothetical protein